MLPSIPRPEDYDVSSDYGFLPAELPLEFLPSRYYAKWEAVAKNLQSLILCRRLREVVDNLPVLSIEFLTSKPELRRAYSLLAFLSHAYIWGGDRPAEVVPPSISIPFKAVCRELGLPTVATYAGVCLWNFKPIFDDEPFDNLDNLSTLLTFTGSLDESWFYLVSVAIEARGAPIITIMLDAVQAARDGDVARVVLCLQQFAERLDGLKTLLLRMHDNCDPHVFYHRIRPFLAGSKNMGEAGLPDGVIFDDGTDTPEFVQYSGGSNAQSSIIQFFDIMLGVNHLPTGSTNQDNPSKHNFIQEMRQYMPALHRQFLERVSSVANIRPFVEARPQNKLLTTSYDACLAMLRAFRDSHLQMVSRYIIIKSKEQRSRSKSPTPSLAPARINLASRRAGRDKNLRGTGGTALIPFLKQARDETGEPAIGTWARRILSNGPGHQPYASLGGVSEHANGKVDIVGLAGIWTVDDSEGGICHW